MKLSKVFEEYSKAEAKKAANEAEIAELEAKREDLNRQFDEALEQEDRVAAKKIRDQIKDVDLDLEVCKRRSIAPKVTTAEIREAWRDFAAEKASGRAKKMSEIAKVRKVLKKLAEEMILEHNQALGARQKLAALIGGKPEDFELVGLPVENDDNILRSRLPEAVYLTATHEWASNPTGIDNLTAVNAMILFGQYAPDLKF